MHVFSLESIDENVLEIVPYRIEFRRTEFFTRKFEGKTYPVQ